MVVILILCATNLWLISLETVKAQEYPHGRFYMQPSNNVFYTNVTSVGTRFNVTFYAYNLTEAGVWAYQFKAYCDPAVLNITRAWRAHWDSSWIFYGHTTVGVTPSIGLDVNGYYALVGDTLQSPETAYTIPGPVILGIVEFNITVAPTTGMLSSVLNITNANSRWLGPTPGTPHYPTYENGNYEYHYVPVPLPKPYLKIEPETVTAVKPREFVVNVTIKNLVEDWHLIGLQFRLKYNTTFLKAISVTNGSFLMPWAIYGTYPIGMIDEELSEVVFGDFLLPNATGKWDHSEFPHGEGVVAQIKFLPKSHTAVSFDLNLSLGAFPGFFIDKERTYIPYDPPQNATYIYDPLGKPLINVTPGLYTASHIAETFNINITINDLDARWNMTYAEFKLVYNNACLQFLDVLEGPFLGQFGSTMFNHTEGDDYTKVNITLTPTVGYPSGTGTLATIRFNVTSSPGRSTLALNDTRLLDFEMKDVLYEAQDGYYQLHEVLIHSIIWETKTFDIVTVSNTSVAPVPMNFNQTYKLLYFNVTGYDDTVGFVNITIPKALLNASIMDWYVIVGGWRVQPIVVENATHTMLYFTFSSSVNSVHILGTWVVPEMPTSFLLLVLLAACLTSLAFAKRIQLKKRKESLLNITLLKSP
jgi:hypothetical protein